MKPIEFPQATHALSAPGCHPLQIHTDGEHCCSVWELSNDDIMEILQNGRIYVFVRSGTNQPPILLQTEDPFKSSALGDPDGG